jgi:hypothetical protein
MSESWTDNIHKIHAIRDELYSYKYVYEKAKKYYEYINNNISIITIAFGPIMTILLQTLSTPEFAVLRIAATIIPLIISIATAIIRFKNLPGRISELYSALYTIIDILSDINHQLSLNTELRESFSSFYQTVYYDYNKFHETQLSVNIPKYFITDLIKIAKIINIQYVPVQLISNLNISDLELLNKYDVKIYNADGNITARTIDEENPIREPSRRSSLYMNHSIELPTSTSFTRAPKSIDYVLTHMTSRGDNGNN